MTRNPWRRWAGPLVIAAVCVATAAAGADALHALRYDRAGLAQGQWWRLVSGSVVHLGAWHLLQDLAGLAVLGAVSPQAWSVAGWMARLLWTAAIVSALLWWCCPQVDTYAGLSGPLYGLFVIALLPSATSGDRLTAVALAVLAVGVGIELGAGSPAAEERLIGGHVVAESHLAGAVAGLFWVGVERVLRRGPAA